MDRDAETDVLRGDSEWLQQFGDLPRRDLFAVPILNPKFIAGRNQLVCQFLRRDLGNTLRLENLLDVVKEKDPDLLHWRLVADRDPPGALRPIATSNIRD